MNGWPMHNYLSAEAFTANFSRRIGYMVGQQFMQYQLRHLLYAIPAEMYIVLAIIDQDSTQYQPTLLILLASMLCTMG
jgi:hypothetical protein